MIIEVDEKLIMFTVCITPETKEEWDLVEKATVIVNGKKPEMPIVVTEKTSIFFGDTEPEGRMCHGLKIYHKPFTKICPKPKCGKKMIETDLGHIWRATCPKCGYHYDLKCGYYYDFKKESLEKTKIEDLPIGTKIVLPCGEKIIADGIDVVCNGKKKQCSEEQKKKCQVFDPFAGLP